MEEFNGSHFHFQEISQDFDIHSLFNQCPSGTPQPAIQYHQPYCDVQDLIPEEKEVARGYGSDQQGYLSQRVRQSQIRITHKKEQRKRKKHTKIYIKVLQTKIMELKAELDQLKKLNKVNKEYIHRLNESEHLINGYFVGRQQVIQKLENLSNRSVIDKSKLMDEIVSLRLRQGVYGKDRVKAVNYYFREMVEMVLPEIQKYIITTAIEEEDFFDASYLRTGIPASNVENWRRVMLENIGAEIKQKTAKQYLFNNRFEIITEANKFNQILLQLGQNKCKLTEQAKKLEQVLDRAHKFMSPIQISKSICYIDKYRFEKNISLEHTFKEVFEKIEAKDYAYDPNQVFCRN